MCSIWSEVWYALVVTKGAPNGVEVDIPVSLRWFDLFDDPDTKTCFHRFNHKYWDAKLRKCWDASPDIF